VSGFEAIFDQERPVRLLTTSLRKGTIPHALLFTGVEGVGKKSIALAFAKACNCTAAIPDHLSEGQGTFQIHFNRPEGIGPCGRCRSCGKIQSGNHPDIIQIEPAGSLIKIDQIRDLSRSLLIKPYEAAMRVVVLADAHRLNPEAGNALLKALEEPSARTMFILIAPQTADLLPTIVSRCQHVRFNPIPRKRIESLLAEKHGVDANTAMIAAFMANGSISKALMISDQTKTGVSWIGWRNWMIQELAALPSRSTRFQLAFAEILLKRKAILPETFDMIKSWLRDLVISKYDPEKILNRDLGESIQQASQHTTVGALLSKIKAVQTTQKQIEANANLRLALEQLILQLASG
jgi:DNA polymerase-3 subunit delta'